MLQEFHFEEFSFLDFANNADFLINSMEVMHKLNSIRYIKRESIKKIKPQPGEVVLEVGCGHGYDSALISDFANNKIEIYAVDASKKMLDLAVMRNKRPGIHYIHAPILKTNFEPEKFDSIYADRFLVSHKNKEKIINFLFKLLKPGGKILITDVDASSIILYPFDDVSKLLLQEIISCFINPHIGRELPALLIDSGFKNIETSQNVSMIQDLNLFKKIFELDKLIETMISKGTISNDQASSWLKNLSLMNDAGKFLYSVNLFTVLAKK